MTDEEREEHIKSCGLLLLKAHREGDIEGAKRWLELQNEAVKARTPRQIARMEGCYFAEEGDRARQAAQGRADLG